MYSMLFLKVLTYLVLFISAFQENGDPSRISFEYNPTIGQYVSLSNKYDDIKSLLESGRKLDTVVGWLEMTPETFEKESCLFDVNQCHDGFTIQFWLKVHECKTIVSKVIIF